MDNYSAIPLMTSDLLSTLYIASAGRSGWTVLAKNPIQLQGVFP